MKLLTPYEIANRLEDIAINLRGPIEVIDMVAESTMSPKTSAMWLASETLEKASTEIDLLVSELMEIHRAQLKIPKSKRA